MKKLVVMSLILVVAFASLASAEGFEKGKLYLGPTLGLAWSGFGFGVSGDYAVDKNWGVGGDIAYTSFSRSYGGGYGYSWKWKYTVIGVLAAASYHFKIENNSKFDPYLKAGLGYYNWNTTYTDPFGGTTQYGSAAYTSGIGFSGAAGAHYFFTPKMAGRVQVGSPFYFAVGLDFVI